MSPSIIGGKKVEELVAEHLSGSYHPFGELIMKLEEVFAGKNIRSNKDGGRFPRPGYEDSGVDLSSYNFVAGRGIFTAEFPLKIWLAGDDGTNVKILYMDADSTSAFFKQAFDAGLLLTKGKYVEFLEWEGDVYYANGADTVGRLVNSTLAAAASAGATSVTLQSGTGIRYPTASGPYTVRGGGLSFTYATRTGDALSGIPASGAGSIASNLAINTVLTYSTTLAPTYQTNAAYLAEIASSLNLAGDPKYPRVWEFSKFANPGDLTLFYNFSGGIPAGTELLGAGDKITGWYKAPRSLYTFKKRSFYATVQKDIDAASGARTPTYVAPFGISNPRCVDDMNGRLIMLTSNRRVLLTNITVDTIQGQTAVEAPKVDPTFDAPIQTDLKKIDIPGDAEWVKFNRDNQLAKIRVNIGGVPYIMVYDAYLNIWYPMDDNKNFDCVTNYIDGFTYCFDGSANKIYIDEKGNYDDTVPVNSEWETGRTGQQFKRSTLRYVYLHGKMTQGSQAYIDVYKEGAFQFTKLLTDAYRVTDSPATYQVGYGSVGSTGFGNAGSPLTAFDFRFPIGAKKNGQDFKIKVRSPGDRGDFIQCEGLKLGVEPLARSPFKHA